MAPYNKAWLDKLGKAELQEAASILGEKYNRADLKARLHEIVKTHLSANAVNAELEKTFKNAYQATNTATPVVTGSEMVKVETTKTPAKRRKSIAPKASEDIVSDVEAPRTVVSKPRTPARSLATPAAVSLPASPAQVVEAIERQTTRFSTWSWNLYSRTGVQKRVDGVRDRLSTAEAIIRWAIILEAVLLGMALLPFKYLGIVFPEIATFGLPAFHLRAPQFWNLLELRFWSTAFLWSIVSVIGPAVFAYLINLPHKAKRQSKTEAVRFDPFVFNLAKLVLTWLVFVQHSWLPTYSLRASRIDFELDIPGGHLWLVVSSLVGGAIALYEAILTRH